jgi:hypothetical protein
MNRIYQGRVTKVEVLKSKDADGQPQELPNWQRALWTYWQRVQEEGVSYRSLAVAAQPLHFTDQKGT